MLSSEERRSLSARTIVQSMFSSLVDGARCQVALCERPLFEVLSLTGDFPIATRKCFGLYVLLNL